MGKVNSVIAGDYTGKDIVSCFGSIYITIDYNDSVTICKSTVESYSIVDENQQKSATSAVGRAMVGGALLGGVGLFAGLSAKNKRTFTVEILFKDGKKSLALLNDKTYAALLKALF